MNSGNANVSAKVPFKVLMGNVEPRLGEIVGELVTQVVGAGHHVRLVEEGDADEVRARAAAERFDLFVIVLNNVPHPGEAPGEQVSSLDKSLGLVAGLRAMTAAPIVVLSGNWRPGLEHEAEQAGANIFFQLPFALEKLREKLALVINAPQAFE